jgi:hypothetical protein
LYPIAINKSNEFILGSEKSIEIAKKIAKQNKGIASYKRILGCPTALPS